MRRSSHPDHQPGIRQHPQVLADRWSADWKPGGQFAHGQRAAAQPLDDQPPGAIAQRVEHIAHHNLVTHQQRLL